MDKKEIEKKVKEILADRLAVDITKIKPNSKLVNDLGLDSFMGVELAFELKKKLGVEVLGDDFRKIETVNDIINFICSKITKERGKK